jgi:hypothetical protein
VPLQPIGDAFGVVDVGTRETDDGLADGVGFEADAAFAVVGVDEVLWCDGYEGELADGLGGGGWWCSRWFVECRWLVLGLGVCVCVVWVCVCVSSLLLEELCGFVLCGSKGLHEEVHGVHHGRVVMGMWTSA